ncbi:hypothetical protein [Streptomyces sp. NPDC015130]|uniref:hypothetical protein n=1 Tax=Streptomyces sp. NPDC015130 TaxID=3364940 RepID=UPI0036FD632A
MSQHRTDAQLLDLATRLGCIGMVMGRDFTRAMVKAGLTDDEMRRVVPLLEKATRR